MDYPNSSQDGKSIDYLLIALRASQCLPVPKAQAQLDELFVLLGKDSAPLKLLEAYDMQAELFRMDGKWQAYLEIINKALSLSRQLNQSQFIAKFLIHSGFVHSIKMEREKSKKCYEEGLAIAREYDMVEEEVSALIYLGKYYHLHLQKDKGIEYYLKAIELAHTLENDLLLGLAYYFYSVATPDKSNQQEFLKKAFDIFTKHNSLKYLFSIYSGKSRTSLLADEFDKSIEYALKAYELAQQTKAADHQFFSLNRLVEAYTHKASVDSDNIDRELMKEADKWATELIKFTKDREQRQQFENASILKGQVLMHLEEFDQAIEYLSAIDYIIQNPAVPAGNRSGIAFLLSHCYEGKGDFKNALKYHKIRTDLEKKIHDVQIQKSASETEAKFQAKEKKAELNRLKELEELKTRFFSQITHELRTPLTLIQGPAGQILEMSDPNAMIKQARIIKRNADRLLILVNQLLDVNKLEAGKMELKPSHGEIAPFLEDLVSSFQMHANQKQIQLDIISDIGDLILNFDADKIEKILYNLLSNAFKFTPPKGQVICQFQLLDRVNDQTLNIELIVKDTGKGIAEEEIAYIFDRFYQADSSYTREAEGTGIGLALVKELTDLMNGNIEVESELGSGSSFRIVLPMELVPEEEIVLDMKTSEKPYQPMPEMVPKLKNTADPAIKNKPILLLIEDNEDMHHYITNIFENDFILLQAYDGIEGLKMAKERIPDMIISDVMMPGKNGYQVCSELKGDSLTSHIPVILLTAKAALESRIEGLEHGADAYLSKPFNPKELVLQTQNLLATRNNQQEKYKSFAFKQSPTTVEEDKETIFLNKIMAIIHKNIDDESLNVNRLSDLMHMSSSQLYRKIHALTNSSVTHLIRNIRLAKGKELLDKKAGNISEIAYQIGLSPGYFSKCFTKEYGYSPKKLLK